MSDTKESEQLQNNALRREKTSASAGANPQQAALCRGSAMAYWQGVAAAGRAAKPTDEAGKRQTTGQRPVAWAKP